MKHLKKCCTMNIYPQIFYSFIIKKKNNNPLFLAITINMIMYTFVYIYIYL